MVLRKMSCQHIAETSLYLRILTHSSYHSNPVSVSLFVVQWLGPSTLDQWRIRILEKRRIRILGERRITHPERSRLTA
jgi:hypothetical protein